MKKFLALIISLSMVLMCVPGISLVASAEMAGGGTPDNPYVIAEAADFLAVFATGGTLSANKNAYFVQTADIDLSVYTPDNTVDFGGTYDAQGHSITYTISSTADNKGHGAFGRVVGGTIKNLTVKGSITANQIFVGGVAGYSDGATYINCTNEVAIDATAGGNYIGGIAGGAQYPKAAHTFINCKNEADLKLKYGLNAGILGVGFGTFTDCVNNGTITKTASGDLAGILCFAQADVTVADTASVIMTRCVNTKEVSGGTYESYFGGMIGHVGRVNTVSISESYNAGLIHNYVATSSADNPATGLMIGKISDSMLGENPSVTIANCYTTGTINNAGKHYFGSAIGQQASTKATVTLSNFYDSDNWAHQWHLVGNVASGATEPVLNNAYILVRDGYDLISENHIKKATVVGQLIPGFSSDVWYATNDLPKLISLADDTGSGLSEADPIIVASAKTFARYFGKDATAEDIAKITGKFGATTAEADNRRYFKLIKDIILEDYAPHATMSQWVYFDGNGHTINVDITDEDTFGDYVAPIGFTKWSYFYDINIDGAVNAPSRNNVAGLVGRSQGGRYDNITNNADITGKAIVGGIIGQYNSAGNCSNLTNYGTVMATGNGVGGIVGTGDMSGTGSYFTNYGTVTGNSDVAGIWGDASSVANASKFANLGNIAGYSDNVGGIIGRLRGALTLSESYNAGKITSQGEWCSAGIVGYAAGTGDVTITDCFNTGFIYTFRGGKGSALTATDKTSGEIIITNYYDAANQDIEVLELTGVKNKVEQTGATVTVTDAYILNASIILSATGAGASILPADLKAKIFNANWVAPKGVLAYPQLANVEYEGLAVAEVAPMAIAGIANYVDYVAEENTAVEAALEGIEYNNFALVAGKFILPTDFAEEFEYGVYDPYYVDPDTREVVGKAYVANGNNNGTFGILLYNLTEDKDIVLKPYVKYDGKMYFGATQRVNVAPAE